MSTNGSDLDSLKETDIESDQDFAAESDEVWYEDYDDGVDESEIDEFEITSTPNDFNVLTILSFMQSGAIKIPAFQRNYVWDIRRASKLIESLILGLPVPQVFLYEESRNTFLVIDGQQRLMSIYYFMKQRFPKKDKRSEIRQIFDENGHIPDSILNSDEFFSDFRLRFDSNAPIAKNRFAKQKYTTLGEYKATFDLRPIRNIIVKQTSPDESETDGYDSAVFEIFHRLNTGGINLRPQEIRSSLYHSPFYDALYRMNSNKQWRGILNSGPDLHMKDIEILLRAFSMLLAGDDYKSSMMKFLNIFSKRAKKYAIENIVLLEQIFSSFLECTVNLPNNIFQSKANRFNIALFEAVFVAACGNALKKGIICTRKIEVEEINSLINSPVFQISSAVGTTNKDNVEKRLDVARKLIKPC